jgi:hypothetical protein
MKSYIIATVSSCLAISAITSANAANLIVNGGFESPIVGRGGFTPYSNGGSIGGWNVSGPSNGILHIETSYAESRIAFPAQAGLQWVDLTGIGNLGPSAGISQTVATIIGQRYSG